jgi:hypothetical protein
MKVNSIGEIGNRVTPTIDIIPYNISFEAIDETDCYIFEILKTTYDDLLGYMPYVCHGFDLENIDQATYTKKEKGIVRKIDRQYIINSISRIEDSRRFSNEPLAIEFDS